MTLVACVYFVLLSGASAMSVSPFTFNGRSGLSREVLPKTSIDSAFSSWGRQQQAPVADAHSPIQREVNRLAQPDVPKRAKQPETHRVTTARRADKAGNEETARKKRELAEALMQRKVNRMACPDFPVRLVYQGYTKPTFLKGSGSTEALKSEARRLHRLDGREKLEFFFNGASLPLGVAVSESPLAHSCDHEEGCDVHVTAATWWQK